MSLRNVSAIRLMVITFSVAILTAQVTHVGSQAGVPAYQNESWVRTGGPIGGLGYDIRYNFADPNIWYVTDAWSGFHISTDNGLTWTPSNQGIIVIFGPTGDSIPIFSATVDPHDPNVIWIGTSGTGQIFRSSDGGHTWVEMDNGIDRNLRPLTFRGFTVDPRTSDIVYAMGEISSPGWTPDGGERIGLEMDMTQGVVYRTTDGGRNWTLIWRGDNLARYCWIDPRDPNVLYVSTGIFDREAANTDVDAGFPGGVGILKSTDWGQTWRVLEHENGLLDLYIGSLYMNPANPDVLLAAAGQNNWSTYGGANTGGVYLTVDGGEHWTRVLPAEDEIFGAVEYCDNFPEVAYAASTSAVYRSDDGGHTWQRFGRPNNTWGPPGIVAGFPIDMQCDPRDPMRVFVNNYLGGNFLSEDGGQTWISASRGYTGALVHHLATVRGYPGVVYAASRSGVYRSENGGDDWIALVNPPDDLPAKFNEIEALAVNPSDMYHALAVPGDFGGILYTFDGGQTWEISRVPVPVRVIAFAPSDPNTVYAAVTPDRCLEPEAIDVPECNRDVFGLYVSHDGGITFEPTFEGHALISAVAVHPADPNVVYAAVYGAGIAMSADGGSTWTMVSGDRAFVSVEALEIDPNDPNVIFAGSEMGGIYRSADGGMSWVQVGAGLDAEAPVSSIVVDPTNGQIVYLASPLGGVFLSEDRGTSWQALNNGLTHRSANVLALSYDGRVLYVGIEGDGVYRLGTP